MGGVGGSEVDVSAVGGGKKRFAVRGKFIAEGNCFEAESRVGE